MALNSGCYFEDGYVVADYATCNDCYVEENYWQKGYTELDDCAANQNQPQQRTQGGGYRVSPAFAKRADIARAAFEAKELEYSADLTRTIHAAFEKLDPATKDTSQPAAKPVKKVRKKITRDVYDSVKLENLGYKLTEIKKLIDAFADRAELFRLDLIRKREEDAIILLLLEP